MSVDIEPSELSFQRPFTVEVSKILTLKNPNSTPVVFKVKTTAPKQYLVRPNAGRIEPGQSFDVTVLLQAMKADPEPDAKCRDKFLVQSASITPDKEFASIASVVTQLDSSEKDRVQERKIRVNWLPATEGSLGSDYGTTTTAITTPSKPQSSNTVADTPDASRTFSSPSATAATSDTTPPPYTDDRATTTDDKLEASKATVASAATTVANTAQATYEELKVKLAQAEAQLVALKDQGLRQRNVKGASGSDEKSAPAQLAQAAKQSASGVPVQITAALCVVSFLLAYFFF